MVKPDRRMPMMMMMCVAYCWGKGGGGEIGILVIPGWNGFTDCSVFSLSESHHPLWAHRAKQIFGGSLVSQMPHRIFKTRAVVTFDSRKVHSGNLNMCMCAEAVENTPIQARNVCMSFEVERNVQGKNMHIEVVRNTCFPGRNMYMYFSACMLFQSWYGLHTPQWGTAD